MVFRLQVLNGVWQTRDDAVVAADGQNILDFFCNRAAQGRAALVASPFLSDVIFGDKHHDIRGIGGEQLMEEFSPILAPEGDDLESVIEDSDPACLQRASDSL